MQHSSFSSIEISGRAGAGSDRRFLLSGRALRSHDGARLCLLAVEDITDRVAREQQTLSDLERAQQDRNAARTASQAKDELLAAVSHDLRTPLAALLIQAQALSTGKLSDEGVQRATSLIEHTVELQARLVDDLLDVSRIVTGKLHLQTKRLNLTETTRAGIAVVEPMAKQRSIVLTPTLEEDVHVLGDAGRIQQVIWNLLTNAIKFSSAGGSVRIALTTDANNATLKVEDAGAGISEHDLPFVFDRFMQSAHQGGGKAAGLGLGLSIAQGVVHGHGGTIRAESPGRAQGSTFTVTLPLARRAAKPRS